MKVQEIDTTDLATLEKEYRLFPRIPHEKARALLESKIIEEDENFWIKGTGHVSNIPESILMSKESNERFQYLEKLQKDIEAVFPNLSDELQEMVRLYFWGEYSYLGWSEIADKEHTSRSKVYAMRYKILETLAKKRGML